LRERLLGKLGENVLRDESPWVGFVHRANVWEFLLEGRGWIVTRVSFWRRGVAASLALGVVAIRVCDREYVLAYRRVS